MFYSNFSFFFFLFQKFYCPWVEAGLSQPVFAVWLVGPRRVRGWLVGWSGQGICRLQVGHHHSDRREKQRQAMQAM